MWTGHDKGEVSAGYDLTGDFLAGRLRQHMAAEDLRHIDQMVSGTDELDNGEFLVRTGELCTQSALLVNGFMFRSIERDDRRYIIGVNVPGDFVDLHGFALNRLDHDIIASGPVRLALVPHDRLRETVAERPGVARALWFATLLDAAIHRKWILTLEHLDAPRRIAHIYAELQTRLELIGRANPHALRTPFTQTDVAAMCGVTPIHANRAIARLREMGLAELRRGDLFTDSWERLKAYCGFDASYLYGPGSLQVEDRTGAQT